MKSEQIITEHYYKSHLPGPWAVCRDGDGVLAIDCGGSLPLIAVVGQYYGRHEYNAALMAAAPDLLGACLALFALVEAGVLVRDTSKDHLPKWYKPVMELTKELANAKAAIIKATTVAPPQQGQAE